MVSPPRVTNIPQPAVVLTIEVGEENFAIPQASWLDHAIEAQPVTCVSIPSQPTFLLLPAINSRLVGNNLTRIRTLSIILDKYQMRLSSPKEWVDWRSPRWVSILFYEVAFIARFRFLFPKLIRDFFVHFEISPSQVLPNVWRNLLSLLVLAKSLDMELELTDLLYSYFLKEHDSEKRQYTLYRRKGRSHLITELSTFNKLWKNNFFLCLS